MKKVFISASRNSELYNILREELRFHNYSVVEEENFGMSSFEVQNLIKKASIFIALIEDENPNIFFELGCAIGLGKNVLIAHSPFVDLPSDMMKVNSLRISEHDNNIIFDILKKLDSYNVDDLEPYKNYSNSISELRTYKTDPAHFEQIDPQRFEELIYNLFFDNNFNPMRSEERFDLGFDFYLQGFKNHFKTIVEVKKYNKNSKVSLGKVQQLLGAIHMSNSDHGILITSSDFTGSAKDYCKRTYDFTNVSIDLWTMDDLIEHFTN